LGISVDRRPVCVTGYPRGKCNFYMPDLMQRTKLILGFSLIEYTPYNRTSSIKDYIDTFTAQPVNIIFSQ